MKPEIASERGEQAEEQFLASLLEFTRTAKKSQRPEIAKAARHWERKLVFRIKMHRQWLATSSRSALRSRSGGAPSRD